VTGPLHVFMPYGRAAASARIRVFGWLEHLRLPAYVHCYIGQADTGPSTIMRRPLAVLSAERDLRRTDEHLDGRVLIHREASPFSRGEVERALFSKASLSVFDFDDAMHWDWGASSLVRRLLPKAGKTIEAVRRADRVIAGNAFLADWASCWSRETLVIPSCIEPARYQLKTSYVVHDPPRLGWIGTPATERYLRSHARALLEIHRQTGARVTVISRGRGTLNELDTMVDRADWSVEAESYLAEWDIGIMPLDSGLYERGKSGYKLLQYGAAGLPAIGSPVGVNQEILTKFGAASPTSLDEWVEATLELLRAPQSTRENQGRQGRTVVEKEFSFGAWAETWQQSVEGVETGKPHV
jgi:glycosyltransferase involved in cell wall biosynthesis